MKTTIFLFAILSLLIGCKKSDDATALNPDLTVGLTGVYPLTYYSEGAQFINLPSNGVSGQFDLTKVDLTHVRAKLTITDSGVTEEYSANDFELKRDGNNSSRYNIFVDGQSVGSMSAADIDVSASSPDGTVSKIKAKR